MTKCKYCGRDELRQCYDSDITDEGFEAALPFLEARPKAKAGRPVEYRWRDVIDSIFYVLRTGCPWRQMPHDVVQWWAAYRWFRTLARDGTWQRIHDGLHARIRAVASRNPEPTACALDSQSVQSSEGGGEVSFDKFKHCRGRKRHLGGSRSRWSSGPATSRASRCCPGGGLSSARTRGSRLTAGWRAITSAWSSARRP